MSALGAAPVLDQLEDAHSILLAGAGGGFDVYSAIPLYMALRARGKTPILANLSFAELDRFDAPQLTPICREISAEVPYDGHYHPELSLARWLKSRGEPDRVYAFQKSGTRPTKEVYRALQQRYEFDAVVLVDGGTDILMRGDEQGLGTPVADMTSLISAVSLGLPSYGACLGFGVDHFHGVCTRHCLEAIAELTRAGAFLGALSVLPQSPEGQAYLELVRFANTDMEVFQSIVCNSVATAVEGEFGDVHRSPRTQGSTLFINPLMATYFCFELPALAERLLYRDLIEDSADADETARIIGAFHKAHKARKRKKLPL